MSEFSHARHYYIYKPRNSEKHHNVYKCTTMYIHNVYSGKCYPMYINALQCIYPMYIDVTQCITPNVYSCQYTLGIYIVLQFFWRPYIHWVTVYTLWCRLIFVTQCIYCVTQCIYGIYIGTHVYTL